MFEKHPAEPVDHSLHHNRSPFDHLLGHRRVKEREMGSKTSISSKRENAVLAARSTGKPTKNPGVR
jgi:hypothetical protein